VIDKRINFRFGGAYQGGSGAPGSAESSGNKSNSNSNSSNNSNNNDGPRGPQELGTSTRTVNRITAPPAQEYIGGKSFNVTPETRDDRERARVKQSILDAPIPNITDKGISFFKDGNLLTNSFMAGDNPLSKPKFNMGNLMFNAALFAINPALAAKYRQAKSLYTGAKYATNLLSDITGKNVSKPFDVVEDLTKKIGIKDKNVIESFKDSLTNNLTSKPKRKPVINTNASNDRDGINSLENANTLQDEYTILLQKLQTGNISDAEQARYAMLKNMLGL
jgi:hypothetical protein